VRSANRDLLIVAGESAPVSQIEALQADGIEVAVLPEHGGRLSLPALLNLLSERKITSLLLEGGAHLNGAFLRQNLVDKVVLFRSDVPLGDNAIPFAYGADTSSVLEESLLRPRVTMYGPDSCISGYLHDPWG
ncbi:MAG TPA: dihydrofolate reductase family protein, partial [Edaphobacter sp.]